LEKITHVSENEKMLEQTHKQNLKQRLEEIQSRILQIETMFEDKLLGVEVSLSLHLQMENLQIEERDIQREIDSNIQNIEVIPIDDGIDGETRVIHAIEMVLIKPTHSQKTTLKLLTKVLMDKLY
jgi:hypothetical protein